MNLVDKILDGLSPQQRDAVTSTARATRVVACAGAGKTETMARRVVLAIHRETSPEEIVAFTFTERAAREMKTRILRRASDMLGSEVRDRLGILSIGTIHAWCFRFLQDRGAMGNFDLLDQHQERAFLSRHGWDLGLETLGEKLLGERIPYPRALELFRKSASAVYSELVDREDLRASSPKFAAYLDDYERLLEDHRLLTFDRVIALTVDRLKRDPSSRPSLRHLLVDEYQDVNPAQEALASLLAGKDVSIFVVGDPHQCIFEWRGSDAACFERFTKRFPGTKTVTVSENRRSREEIVAAANHYGTSMAAGSWTRMSPIRPDAPKAVWLTPFADEGAEADWVVAKIKREARAGRPLRDMAILLGSVDTAGAAFIDRLRDEGIRFEIGGRSGLFRHDTAQALGRIFAWFASHKWPMNPYDSTQDLSGDELLDSALEDCLGLSGKGLTKVRAEIERLGKEITEEKFANFVGLYHEVLVAIGFLELDPGHHEDAQVMALCGRFSHLLNDFEAMTRRTSADPMRGRGSRKLNWSKALTGFAWYLTGYATENYEEANGDEGSGEEAVRISTIHQAKGLEWPIVFLPSLLNRRFPTKVRSSRDPWLFDASLFASARYEGDEASRRRVLFVALTRARDGLFASWFTQSNGKRSRFLDSIEAGMKPPAASLSTPVPPDPNRRPGLPESETFSPTEIILWRRCPYRYRLTQGWGFQAGLAPELGFGRANHHVVRRIAEKAKAGSKVDGKLVARELEEGFYMPYAPAGMREDMKENARKKLLAYTGEHAAELAQTREVEARIEFPLNSSIVQGVADVLIGDADELEVRDYKTGEEDPGESDFQVRLYSAGMGRTGRPVDRGSVANFETGAVRPVSISPAELTATEKEAESIIGSIMSAHFPAKPGPACAKCDFSRICRYASPS